MSDIKFQIKESSGEWVDTHELMYSKFPEDRRRKLEKCTCDCHKKPGMMHIRPCCERGWTVVLNVFN